MHREVDVAHRPDQLPLGELGLVGPPALGRDEMIDARAVDLPQPRAGELHLPVNKGAGRIEPPGALIVHCAHALQVASLSAIHFAATSSMALPSRSTWPDIALSSLVSIS